MSDVLRTSIIALMVWSTLVEGYFFLCLCRGFGFLRNKDEIDSVLINQAEALLLLALSVDWLAAVAIYLAECIMYGASSGYPAMLLYINSVLLLIIIIVSVAFAVSIAWSKNDQNHLYVYKFRNFVRTSFIFAIILFFSVWVIS